MNIKVGICTDDHRKVNKVIEWLKDSEGDDVIERIYLKGLTNDMHPIIKVSIDHINPIEYNYVKLYWGESNVERTAKCYYVEDRDFEGHICYLHLTEDVLYTFRSSILKLKCNVIRQEFKGSPYIPDDRILCSTKRQLNQYNSSATPFSTSGTGNPVVLTVSGGNS